MSYTCKVSGAGPSVCFHRFAGFDFLLKILSTHVLVAYPCDTATNILRIVYNKPDQPKKKFAVCVKGLNFPGEDISGSLVEWFELLHVLGADMIFLYKFDVHRNVEKVFL